MAEKRKKKQFLYHISGDSFAIFGSKRWQVNSICGFFDNKDEDAGDWQQCWGCLWLVPAKKLTVVVFGLFLTWNIIKMEGMILNNLWKLLRIVKEVKRNFVEWIINYWYFCKILGLIWGLKKAWEFFLSLKEFFFHAHPIPSHLSLPIPKIPFTNKTSSTATRVK